MTESARASLKVLAFDVFGTVVDWYSSIEREVCAMDLPVSGGEFALAWRGGYLPILQEVLSGQRPWAPLDALHRVLLDRLIVQYKLEALDEAQRSRLNSVWHRLDPWPDAVEGLTRLKRNYILCTLSNGNISLLVDLARHGRLPWDCVLSAQSFKCYKPDPATYLGVADTFGVEPQAVMMVAAHSSDLEAARACGLQTAYVERALEYGPDVSKDVSGSPQDTYHAADLIALAQALGC